MSQSADHAWSVARNRGMGAARRADALRFSSSALTLTPPAQDVRVLLSQRERQVLLVWLSSDSKVEAAQTLYLSVGTINTHLTRIRAKYAAAGRPAPTKAALFARALQDGLTQLGDW